MYSIATTHQKFLCLSVDFLTDGVQNFWSLMKVSKPRMLIESVEASCSITNVLTVNILCCSGLFRNSLRAIICIGAESPLFSQIW